MAIGPQAQARDTLLRRRVLQLLTGFSERSSVFKRRERERLASPRRIVDCTANRRNGRTHSNQPDLNHRRPDLSAFQSLPKGLAVDVDKSVSRVAGNSQLPAYRAVAGNLCLFDSQLAAPQFNPLPSSVQRR
jgi:hypothetical protein